jgi:hypothetical protein
MAIFQGGCHCGRIRFEVEGEPGAVVDCNCSMCRRRGGLLWFVPRDALRLQTAVGDLATYSFNKHAIHHHFCPTCGIAPFSEAADSSGGLGAAVNVRCLEGVDLAALEITPYDGAHA